VLPAGDNLVQLVDVVQPHIGQIGHRRIDVARQPEVDDHQRLLATGQHIGCHQVLVRARGGDGDVGFGQQAGHVRQRHGRNAELLRQLGAAAPRAVGDDQL